MNESKRALGSESKGVNQYKDSMVQKLYSIAIPAAHATTSAEEYARGLDVHKEEWTR